MQHAIRTYSSRISNNSIAQLIFTLAIIAACVYGLVVAMDAQDARRCEARWGGSGLKAKLGTSGSGCLVQTQDGRWVPEEAVKIAP